MVQDGFQLYTHNFIISEEGQWTVIQQGMSTGEKMARRYHWHSADLRSFVDDPHTAICGTNQGLILNLADTHAAPARNGILDIATQKPETMMRDILQLVMPSHHDVRAEDVDLKRLGSILWLAHEKQPAGFEELVLLEGVGPRTLQSLALVSEVIHGAPTRFKDPARFAFAHGGKDGHPFPVPIKVYDETIGILSTAIYKAKLGQSEKQNAIRSLTDLAQRAEKDFVPAKDDSFRKWTQKENEDSWKYGGRTVFGKAKPPSGKNGRSQQMRLF